MEILKFRFKSKVLTFPVTYAEAQLCLSFHCKACLLFSHGCCQDKYVKNDDVAQLLNHWEETKNDTDFLMVMTVFEVEITWSKRQRWPILTYTVGIFLHFLYAPEWLITRCMEGCLLERHSAENHSMIFLLSICCRAGGKPVGSPAILTFNILMSSFQYTYHCLNVVPVPSLLLWLLGMLFGKIQFVKLALLILISFISRKGLFEPWNNISLTAAY